MTSFSDFGLAAPITLALADEGYTVPTPIQAQAIPHVLAGRDLLAIAQTGTGKTAAFALPILQLLATKPRPLAPKTARVLVLAPTRELSNQIEESFQAYGRRLALRTAVAIGGVPIGRQIRALADGVHVLIATPGRLADLQDERAVRLDAVDVLVLDEADRMLDMGFIHAIRAIVAKLPKVRQSLFFSATMPAAIGGLAANLLTNPMKVAVTPVAKTADRVEQHAVFVESGAKPAALAKLLNGEGVGRSLVFARTKHGADRVVKALEHAGIEAGAIHGNKSQPQRERALEGFRNGHPRVLVATDIAARGIDVDDITHVINYDLPNEPESYVHRIGRTARAGADGIAISLVAGSDERAYLRAIEKLIRMPVPAMALQLDPADIAAHRAAAGAARPERPDRREQRPAQGRPQNRGHHRNAAGGQPNGAQPKRQSTRHEGAKPAGRGAEGAPPAARHADGEGKGGFRGMPAGPWRQRNRRQARPAQTSPR